MQISGGRAPKVTSRRDVPEVRSIVSPAIGLLYADVVLSRSHLCFSNANPSKHNFVGCIFKNSYLLSSTFE